MFGLQRGLWQRLVALGMPKSWADTFEGAVSNLVQGLEHQGPVKIKTSSGDNALELANYTGHGPGGETGGNALWVSQGDGVTGDSRQSITIEGSPAPPDTYHTYWFGTYDNYQVFDWPATCNDDLRINDVIKYGLPARGSTILRVRFLAPFSGQPGDVQMAQAIDKNLAPISGPRAKDFSGNDVAGSGVFPVTDVLGMAADFSGCNDPSPLGYVVYVSELAKDGERADCSTKADVGGWELVSYKPVREPLQFTRRSIDVVTKVCCLNGSFTVCTATIQFVDRDSKCDAVAVGSPGCPC